jgi:hypothetical protein
MEPARPGGTVAYETNQSAMPVDSVTAALRCGVAPCHIPAASLPDPRRIPAAFLTHPRRPLCRIPRRNALLAPCV